MPAATRQLVGAERIRAAGAGVMAAAWPQVQPIYFMGNYMEQLDGKIERLAPLRAVADDRDANWSDEPVSMFVLLTCLSSGAAAAEISRQCSEIGAGFFKEQKNKQEAFVDALGLLASEIPRLKVEIRETRELPGCRMYARSSANIAQEMVVVPYLLGTRIFAYELEMRSGLHLSRTGGLTQFYMDHFRHLWRGATARIPLTRDQLSKD